MLGNVWEWCLDWYGPLPGGSVTDPLGTSSGSTRVIRGGANISMREGCRSAVRGYAIPAYTSGDGGFRPVLAPSP